MRDFIEHRIMDLKLQNVKLLDAVKTSNGIGSVDDMYRQMDKNKGGLEELTRLIGYIPYEPVIGQSIQSAVTNTKPKVEKIYI